MEKEPFQPSTHKTSLALKFPDQAERNDNLIAGFSTRRNGVSQTPFSSLNLGFHVPDRARDVLINRETLAYDIGQSLDRWIVGEQIHGADIANVTAADKGRGATNHQDAIPKVDGLYTDDPEVLLTALYADCVPLYFYAPAAKRVGIAHAGWKGTTKNIAGEMIRAWNNDGIQTDDIYAAIGPSIGKCCYEVDDGVIEHIKALVGDQDLFFDEKATGKYQLDLKAVNRELLLRSGIKASQLSVSDYCTSCSNLFFSHRNENGKTGRMMAYIGLGEV
ncbi:MULTISPECIES: peptidoglycan editing factor PgeF [Bacillaceae]|uniref:peptidoglycan editing factor PgeF n=1 Tax=Bacillales TaxID=1385 RepID=UPI001883DF8D|nr:MULTISPECIES: peptidoglycan editing factor PgeF [Bacillaceae]MBF0708366.1 peptidoglycan editing factor PgeF [Pseudalkalibacillus hwajinpoensis]MDO6655556.1 peptidoglycan editing factor PgeF [Anaerobacillus sp. 1_MG-2023]